MQIFAALREDSQQGWVWLQDRNLPARSIVRIKNTVNRKVIYCEALQIDDNFLNVYNEPHRVKIKNPQGSIVINGWYRASLGGLSTQTQAALNIRPCNSLWGKFMACTYHPQTVVRIAAWLGLVSVLLGLVGLIISLASVFR